MTTEEQQKEDYYINLGILAGQIFTPNSPIDKRDLFSGRTAQMRSVTDVIFQKGQHAIIFGERGVGKTSLAKVLQEFLPNKTELLVTMANCNSADDFLSVWRKIFDGITYSKRNTGIGYMMHEQTELFSPSAYLKDTDDVPHQVFKALQEIPNAVKPVIIIDEFDKLSENVRPLFADFIKNLSDQSLSTTIVLTGVGESVTELIHDHQSVSRSLIQIPMPRMTQQEIAGILTKGIDKLDNMTISDTALSKIIVLTKGLPHYAHLIGLFVTRDALDHHSKRIDDGNVENAINKAIEGCQYSIKTNYYTSIRSTKKISLFEDVLLACAMAELDELGEFSAGDLRTPMFKITGSKYDIPAYAQHLSEFCDIKRGNILLKTGERKRIRYKFTDPLMQPYIIMKGIERGKQILIP